jgi:putative toxin-antitoxin system antitoxin component (TIGR02293 family)
MDGMGKRVESESPGPSLPQGERAKCLAKLATAAEYVFDDLGDATEWLTNPHPELAGRTPLEAAQSEIGARNAEHILDRIFYGLLV